MSPGKRTNVEDSKSVGNDFNYLEAVFSPGEEEQTLLQRCSTRLIATC